MIVATLGAAAFYYAHYWVFHSEHFFGDKRKALAYAARPEVQREVRAACDAFLGHPAHRPRRTTIGLRNLATFWFFMMQDRERCAAELARVGDAFTDRPWSVLGRPEKQIRAVRAWAQGGRWRLAGW